MPDGEKDLVCISLTDGGEGMPAEVAQRAFEPFFTTKPAGKGTGLGLSQIHGFAAQTGGRAEIESSEGKGTTIRLLLPRSDKPMPQAESESGAATLPPASPSCWSRTTSRSTSSPNIVWRNWAAGC